MASTRRPHGAAVVARTLSTFPVGDGQVALAAGGRPAVFVVPAEVARALEALRSLRTLDEHEAAATRGLSPQHAARTREVLRDLAAAEGALVSEQVLLDPPPAAGDNVEPRIETVGFLTCDRVERLARGLESYAQNAREHGAGRRFVVVDDSKDPATRGSCRAAVRTVAQRFGVEASYAGREEKEAFAARLCRESCVDPELVEFGLFDPLGSACAIGANRNALFLHCVGEAFLSADDDTVARVAAPPDVEGGLVLVPPSDPTEFRFFENRRSALETVPARAECAVRPHEEFLGRTFGAILRRAEGPIEVGGLDPHMIDSLASGKGQVMVTSIGVLGDSGLYSGVGFLTILNSAPSESDYALSSTSREVLRAVRKATLTHGTPLSGWTLGFDHRQSLVPFVPVFRNEDGVFGLLLSRCVEHAYIAHVPRAIFHDAEPREGYTVDRIEVAKTVRFSDMLMACVSAHRFAPGIGDRDARLRGVGQYLEQLGGAAPREYEIVTRTLLLTAASQRALRLEGLLTSRRNEPAYWAADVRAHLRALREAIARSDYHVPLDLRTNRTLEDAVRLGQRIVHLFGRFLQVWPELVASAARMRARGVVLAPTA
jgi:hypothetical protein